MNPATGNDEPYYRIKESYRDKLGRVHSLVLLSPGFIKGYSGKELNLTSKALNKLMLHKGESATLFGDILSEYPERVASLAREYWSQMEAKGTVDTFQEKKRRDENSLQGRLLLKSDTLEHKEGRDLGAEWLCLQTIRQLGLDTFLLAQGWSEEKVQFTLAHLITRTVYTPSELKSMRIIQENSAVADILGLEVNMRPAGGYTPDLMNFAHSTDVYQIWADMVAFDERRKEAGEQYFCAYASRRDCYSYVHTHGEVLARYGTGVYSTADPALGICMCQRMPDALSDALGNQVYVARFASRKEIQPFFDFVCERA